MWPVQHANGVEHGCSSGPESQPSELQSFWAALDRLIQALQAQTEAITELMASNAALMEALSQGDDQGDEEEIPRGMGKKQ
jgi:prefoldin subunit 5